MKVTLIKEAKVIQKMYPKWLPLHSERSYQMEIRSFLEFFSSCRRLCRVRVAVGEEGIQGSDGELSPRVHQQITLRNVQQVILRQKVQTMFM